MRYIHDPYLKLYLPLRRKLGSTFMSDDVYGHLCTVTGAIWTPQGRWFDKIDDKIVIPPSVFSGTGDMTIGAWFKTTDNTASQSICDKRTAASVIGTWHFKITANKVRWAMYGAAEYQFDITGTAIVANDSAWHFAVGVRSGLTGSLYVDNIADGTAATGALADISATQTTQIGLDPRDGLPFGGTIGEVFIYGRALALSEHGNVYFKTKWRY